MKINYEDEHNELLHWLALNYPGVYRMWSITKDSNAIISKRK